MIRPALLATALTLAAATPAHARDARLATRLFNPDEVVQIEGRIGIQASIAFAEDEHIENVAIGDSTSWQVTPNKRTNLLFVKPLAARARTNMTVVTDRRTYFFDLVAGQGGNPLYVLRFKYPAEPKTDLLPKLAGGQALTSDEAKAIEAGPADRPVDPALLNFAWRTQGKTNLLPARIYDDGTSTYLTWASDRALPAIQVRDEKGTEGPVNFAVRGDVIVVDGVPGVIILRSGREMATLVNKGPLRKPADLPPLAANEPSADQTPPASKGQ